MELINDWLLYFINTKALRTSVEKWERVIVTYTKTWYIFSHVCDVPPPPPPPPPRISHSLKMYIVYFNGAGNSTVFMGNLDSLNPRRVMLMYLCF